MSKLKDAIGAPRGRYSPVAAAYEGMSSPDREAFRVIIRDAESYTHAQVAQAMRDCGYAVDRKQIQNYRERLALGKEEL
jgi:hypothetical protein